MRVIHSARLAKILDRWTFAPPRLEDETSEPPPWPRRFHAPDVYFRTKRIHSSPQFRPTLRSSGPLSPSRVLFQSHSGPWLGTLPGVPWSGPALLEELMASEVYQSFAAKLKELKGSDDLGERRSERLWCCGCKDWKHHLSELRRTRAV